MECPFCRTGVGFDGFVVGKAKQGTLSATRDIWKAARWARIQDRSLRDYLQTREGAPYRNVWTDAQIDDADQRASSEAG
jgi:hypothetical protein